MVFILCSPSRDENSLLPDQGRSLPFFRDANRKVENIVRIWFNFSNNWS